MTSRGTIVLGAGATGRSAVAHLYGREEVALFDTRAAPPGLDRLLADFPRLRLIDAADWDREAAAARRVVVSPGIGLDHCLVRRAARAGARITSDIELFLDAAAAPVIGVTGTNGKSTVTALVGQLLTDAGRSVAVGGNFGPPALELLGGGREGYVVELSSFQLERLEAPGLAVACVLNVSEDHLDRHRDLERYAASKRRIYGGCGAAVYNAGDARTHPPAGVGGIAVNRGDWRVEDDVLVLGGETLPGGELTLRGRHNHFNAVAAAAIASLAGIPASAMKPTLRRFRGLPHRCTEVARRGGVAFIDDSKATNVGACLAALDGLGDGNRNLVLIAGGDAKGAAFDALAPRARRHVAHAVLIGRDADRVAEGLAGAVPVTRAGGMREAVRLAWAAARPSGTVLLSPACASFDMYENYAARGRDFAAAAAALEAR